MTDFPRYDFTLNVVPAFRGKMEILSSNHI